MIPINLRCNRKSYSPAPDSGRDSAKLSSEVDHDFSHSQSDKREFILQVLPSL